MTTLQAKFSALESALNSELLERRPEVRGATLALAAGTHVFLLGPPGVGKSALINRMAARITDADTFEILMTRFTTPEEVFGPVSLHAMKQDKMERNIEGYLAEAKLAFVDEIFKANSSILNALLWAINERAYRHGTSIIKIPLSTMFCASNELASDESLAALYDRILFRFDVQPIRDQSNFVKMMKMSWDDQPEPILTWEDVLQVQTEVKAVIVPDRVVEALADLRKDLAAEGITPTERRFRESRRIIQAAAWMDGEAEADIDHIRPLQHVLWEEVDQRDKVDALVIKLANPLDAEAAKLLEDVEGLEKQLDSIAQDEDKNRKGTEIHGKLRRAKKQLDDIEKKAGKSKRRSETIRECRERLQSITERVLVEVFNFNPDAAAEMDADI